MENDLRRLSIFQIKEASDPTGMNHAAVKERNAARAAHRIRMKQKRNGAVLPRRKYLWEYGDTLPRNLPPAEHTPKPSAKYRIDLRTRGSYGQIDMSQPEAPKRHYGRTPIK